MSMKNFKKKIEKKEKLGCMRIMNLILYIDD